MGEWPSTLVGTGSNHDIGCPASGAADREHWVLGCSASQGVGHERNACALWNMLPAVAAKFRHDSWSQIGRVGDRRGGTRSIGRPAANDISGASWR